MKRRNGFTLIELLAIIIILSIIAVITVPIVLNIIDDSQKNVAIDSAYLYRDALNKFYLNKVMNDKNYDIDDGEYDISYFVNEGLDVSGEKPSAGWVMIENAEVTDFSFIIGDYAVTYVLNTDTIEAIKNGDLALTPSMQLKENAKVLALSIVSEESGTTGISDITEGWLAFIDGELKAYSVKVPVDGKSYIVTDQNVLIDNDRVTSTNATANIGTEVASKTSAEQLVISYKVDTYVKAALVANSSIEDEEAYTVSDMSGVTTNQPDSGWVHFQKVDSIVTVFNYSLTYGDYTANYSSLTDGDYVSTFGGVKNKPVIISVGEELCYGPEGSEECFKVIKKFSQEGIQKVMLFSNYNLKKYTDNTTNPATITYKQDAASTDQIAFSESNYWISNDVLVSTYSNNGAYSYDSTNNRFVGINNVRIYPNIYDSNSNTYAYVEGYLDTLKTATYRLPLSATGRLLTVEEAQNITMFADRNELKNGKSYWLGSATTSTNVWGVNSYGSAVGGNNYTSLMWVRPVIVIPTSDIY